jgi:hypothetical protein
MLIIPKTVLLHRLCGKNYDSLLLDAVSRRVQEMLATCISTQLSGLQSVTEIWQVNEEAR